MKGNKMLLYKTIFHINAILKKFFLKLIYGKKISFGKKVTFRRRFNIFIENISGGMGTAAFVAYLSSLCNKKYTATQYALLSSFMGAARDLFAATSGMVAAAVSWQNFFILTTFMAVPGMLVLWFLIRTKAIKDG